MSDLEITTAIACWALVLAIFGFFIGIIYNTKQIKKLNDKIDREKGSIERRVIQLELNIDGHNDLLNDHTNIINHHKDIINMQSHQIANLQATTNDYKDAINKLARHTEYPKSKIV